VRLSLSARAQHHLSVRNSSFIKDRPDTSKARFIVKSYHVHLRVQKNVSRASRLREADGALQKCCPNSSAAVCFQDRHAPYSGAASTDDNPCRSDRLPFCDSEKMKCSLVVPIQFDLLRHSLFLYKDTHANAESVLQFFFGRDSRDANSRFHRLSVCRANASIARPRAPPV
jgi:hypothetical protein